MNTAQLLSRFVGGDRDAAGALAALPLQVLHDEARAHGVLPLVVDGLAGLGDAAESLRQSLAVDTAAEVMADMARERELRLVVAAFARAGVPALLMKGAALAYTIYPRPDLRPRVDTDLLIAASDRRRAHDLLTAEGYARDIHVDGDLVSQQATYVKTADRQPPHVLDLHWAVVNPHAFAATLTFQELAAAAVPIPTLGPGAQGLADVHALLLACVHRSAHHGGSDRLIWLYDIHLLASRFGVADWDAFAALAQERAVLTVCRDALAAAAHRFRTNIPASLALDPARALATGPREPTAAFVSRRGSLHVLTSDLRALAGWRARARLVREHLFPSVEYMKQVYAPASGAPLAWLYAQRAWRGAWKWLARA